MDDEHESNWMQQEKKLVDMVADDDKDCESDIAKEESQRVSKGIITKSLIAKTIEDADYFVEGSVMRNILEAGFEVTWFSDRHPNDIMYCICVNRKTATVTVVFRGGDERLFDLLRTSTMSEYPNPIAHADYEGYSDYVDLRTSVSSEMTRRRRDTGFSVIDEICERVNDIGKEVTDGGKYHLSITGHSLGGGYATLLAYGSGGGMRGILHGVERHHPPDVDVGSSIGGVGTGRHSRRRAAAKSGARSGAGSGAQSKPQTQPQPPSSSSQARVPSIAAAVIEKPRNLQSQDDGRLRYFRPSPVTDITAGVRPFRQAAIKEAPRPGRGRQQCVLVHSKTFKII